MSFILADRVKESCSSPGTGTVTLLGAATGYQSFSAGIGASNTTYYVIADQSGSNWEVGLGTIGAGGTTLARTTVLSSSNSGSLVNFSSGTQDVFCDYPAGKAVYKDASNNVTGYAISGGTIDNTPIGATTPSTGAFTTLKASNNTLLAQSYDQGTGVLQVTGQSTFNGTVVDKTLSLQGGNNLAPYSQALNTTATWSPVFVTIGTGANDPIGGTTANTFIPAASSNQHYIYFVTALLTTTYTLSIYAKSNGYNYLQLFWGAGTDYANYNLSTGVISQNSGGSPTITSVGNGWYRCSITTTLASATNAFISYGQTGTESRAATTTGNGTSGIYIWGAQLELGTVASAYTPTTTAAITTTNNISVPSGQVLGSNGTKTLPTYSFGASTGMGLYNFSAGYLTYAYAGVNQVTLASTGVSMATTGSVSWGADSVSATSLSLNYDAANTLAQRNSTNAQTFRLYNTYTDASNYERLSIDWSTTANTATIVTQNAGTGSARNLAIGQDLYVNSVRVGRGGGNVSSNTSVGQYSINGSATGINTSAFGQYSLANLTSGNNNSANGVASLFNNSTGGGSVANGQNALYYNTTASNLTAIGTSALQNNTTNVATLGTVTGGSSYTNGTYTGVVMTLSSGSTAITYPTATIVVAGGAVTTVTLTSNGVGFKDTTTVLTAPAASIGGTGSGFSVPVATLQSGTGNVAVGYQAGYTNSTGTNNTFNGYQAGYSNTTGISNSFFGYLAGNASTASDNSFFGFQSGKLTTSGTRNMSFGSQSLNSNLTGNDNVAIGYGALGSTTSSSNFSIGTLSLNSNTSGSNNMAFGHHAGYGASGTNANTTGSNNTYIGVNTVGSANNNTNEMVIGYSAVGLGSNTTVIGNSSTTLTKTFGVIVGTNYTVATLPSASTSGVGARAFVTDALAPVFGATVVTGGAVASPVYSDGTNWKVG